MQIIRSPTKILPHAMHFAKHQNIRHKKRRVRITISIRLHKRCASQSKTPQRKYQNAHSAALQPRLERKRDQLVNLSSSEKRKKKREISRGAGAFLQAHAVQEAREIYEWHCCSCLRGLIYRARSKSELFEDEYSQVQRIRELHKNLGNPMGKLKCRSCCMIINRVSIYMCFFSWLC